MFINTKKEAKAASKIASKFGFDRLNETAFYKRYTTNVFSPWSTDSDARAAQSEIAATLRQMRVK